MSKNDDYTTESLLDHFYHQKHHKLIGINLSRQTNTSILRQNNGVTMLFIAEKQQNLF